jgi:hypothetical protein
MPATRQVRPPAVLILASIGQWLIWQGASVARRLDSLELGKKAAIGARRSDAQRRALPKPKEFAVKFALKFVNGTSCAALKLLPRQIRFRRLASNPEHNGNACHEDNCSFDYGFTPNNAS